MITNSKIMAIDASTKSSGVSIFDKNNKLIYYTCIEIKSTDTLKRIQQMTKQIKEIFNQYKPQNIIMEDVLPEDVKHNQDVYKALIYLQAAIVLQLHKDNAKVNFCTASHWRKICGIKIGRGIKRQQLKKASQDLVKQKYSLDVNDDISDAICIGYSYIMQHSSAF